MAKLFSTRIVDGIMDAWVLIRIPELATKSELYLPEMDTNGKVVGLAKGRKPVNTGIVVGVGPGERSATGEIMPVDPRIRPGATVCFFGGGRGGESILFRPPDFEKEMAAEGLGFIAASTVVFVLAPEGSRAPSTPSLVRA